MTNNQDLYKCKVYDNVGEPHGLIKLYTTNDPYGYGTATYSNSVICRIKQCQVKHNGEYVSISEFELEEKGHRYYLKDWQMDDWQPIKVFIFDIVNELQLVWFASVGKEGRLPIWLSILLRGKETWSTMVYRLSKEYDQRTKRRNVIVKTINSQYLEQNIKNYEQMQDTYDLAKRAREQVSKFQLTSDEKQLLGSVKNMMLTMNLDSVTEQQLRATLVSGLDGKRTTPNRAKWIVNNIEKFAPEIQISS